jgi:flavin-dependent dehydrogenase
VASQVKPTTGGGVVFGLTCAEIAAQIASEAVQRGDFSADYLQLYQKRCKETIGFDVNVMLRMRKFLNALSDTQLDAALRFCARIGVDKTLRNVEEIDFQGQTLLTVLKKPAMWAALAYFCMVYLAANP